MIALVAYFAATILLLIFLISITVYTAFLLYSSWMGSPYVPTKQKEIEFILHESHLKQNRIFLELGCGDGRVVRTAVKLYKTKGIGIDVNPLLLWRARIWCRLHKINRISFLRQNMFDSYLKETDYLYLFLMPDLIKRLKPKLDKELKKKCMIISHGFPIKGYENLLIKKIPHTPFPTYFYRI